MIELQRTIAKPVSISGIGLHTGTECKMTFKPAPEKHGISFYDAQYAFADTNRLILKDTGHSTDENRYFCIGKIHIAEEEVGFF